MINDVFIGNPFYKGIDISDISVKGSPDLKAAKEKAFKLGVLKDVKKSMEVFTLKENMDIAFTPLIIFEVAWHYAFIVMENAAALRVDETKKLCRAIKYVRESYIAMCRKDLDTSHMKRLELVKDDFISKCASDLQVLWYSISNELKRNYGNLEFIDELRTDAFLCIVILDVMKEHNKHMDDVIRKKMGHCNSYKNPFVDALREAMEAFVYPADIENDKNVKLSMAIMKNNLSKIDYNVVA